MPFAPKELRVGDITNRAVPLSAARNSRQGLHRVSDRVPLQYGIGMRRSRKKRNYSKPPSAQRNHHHIENAARATPLFFNRLFSCPGNYRAAAIETGRLIRRVFLFDAEPCVAASVLEKCCGALGTADYVLLLDRIAQQFRKRSAVICDCKSRQNTNAEGRKAEPRSGVHMVAFLRQSGHEGCCRSLPGEASEWSGCPSMWRIRRPTMIVIA